MARDMRRIEWSGKRGSNLLHIEAPGCIVNIHKGLTDTQGREVTRVEVICDQYADELPASLPDFKGAKYLAARVVREKAKTHGNR